MKTDASLKIVVIGSGITLLFLILLARLWQLQVVQGKEYAETALENRLRLESIPSPRGIIFDRNGIPLVKNSPYYFVSLRPEAAATADINTIAGFLDMSTEEIRQIVKQHRAPYEPIRLKGGLSFEEVAFIEARLSDYPGLVFDVEESRNYLYGDVGAHLIGYLGKINPRQAKHETFRNVPREAVIGQWGVEKLYDSTLRGVPGKRAIETDALGNRLRILSEQEPEKGSDLFLSIDINLQKAAEEAFGDKMGALVALNPKTGEVLALVSRPSFDPNLFSRGINYEDWLKLSQDKRFPMLNRALQSQFPPGSTFKIITATAALEAGSITPHTRETCRGYIKQGRWTFRCWNRGGHGRVDLHKALVQSCDVYFYLTGEKTGIDAIAYYARQFGLGEPSGIGLVSEKDGLIPDTEWKQRTRNEQWYTGETYNAAIGQGFVLTTPMQLARMMATVANGGTLYHPQILRADISPEPEHVIDLKDETIKAIQSALAGVVSEPQGTGHAARTAIANVAGKTGTAQVISQRAFNLPESEIPLQFRDHAWFVAFAPAESPEIAIAVFVEHGGHGGSAAAPIARRAIEAYLKSQESRHAETG